MTNGSSGFFEQKTKNRRWSFLFASFFTINTMAFLGALFFCVRLVLKNTYSSRGFPHSPSDLNLPALVGAAALAVPFLIASVKKVLAIRGNGSTYMPSLLKAVPLGDEGVAKGPRGQAQERIVRNVAGELAVAASIEEPDIYVLPKESSINAMASGIEADDSSIVITEGALDRLDRDELMALLAHEVSHIANSDTRHFTIMAGWLHGFFWLSSAGRGLIASPGLTFLGFMLMGLGYVCSLFGQVIQAAFSRRRESLADASACQLTRNPGAMARVLRKIGGLEPPGKRSPLLRPELRHFFLSSPKAAKERKIDFGLLDTHPPLPQRIWDLDPLWDGYFWDFDKNPAHFLDDAGPTILWPPQPETVKTRSISLPTL
jgi:Zn-dependent protease with chaperone function